MEHTPASALRIRAVIFSRSRQNKIHRSALRVAAAEQKPSAKIGRHVRHVFHQPVNVRKHGTVHALQHIAARFPLLQPAGHSIGFVDMSAAAGLAAENGTVKLIARENRVHHFPVHAASLPAADGKSPPQKERASQPAGIHCIMSLIPPDNRLLFGPPKPRADVRRVVFPLPYLFSIPLSDTVAKPCPIFLLYIYCFCFSIVQATILAIFSQYYRIFCTVFMLF